MLEFAGDLVNWYLALFVHFQWPLHQLDIKNVFLNGILSTGYQLDIKNAFAQPSGFIDPQHPSHVCRLKKALYGLRQAPLAWYQRFNTFLIALGFHQSRCDTSMFSLHRDSSIYLLLYVDDIIITGNSAAVLQQFISRASKEFALKDLGALNYFLGLEITSQQCGIFTGQAKYAHDILYRAQMLDCKPVCTPLAAGESLLCSGTPFFDPLSLSLFSGCIAILNHHSTRSLLCD